VKLDGKGPRPQRRPARARPIRAPVSVLALAFCALGMAGGGAGDAGAPEQVLSELRAADEARRQLADEEQAWALEKERLVLLKETVLREAERMKVAARQAAQQEEALKERLALVEAEQARADEIEDALDALAERLEARLSELAERSLPGLVPPQATAPTADPASRLSRALARLDEVERRTQRAAVELVTGTLNGEAITAKLLRAGGVAAWWMALDGSRAGVAHIEGSDLLFSPAADAAELAAIVRAFAIAEGQAPPAWVLLPFEPEETQQ